MCSTNMAPYPTLSCFLYFMDEKFNKNAKVEKITNMLGIAVCLIVIDPFVWHTRDAHRVKYEI